MEASTEVFLGKQKFCGELGKEGGAMCKGDGVPPLPEGTSCLKAGSVLVADCVLNPQRLESIILAQDSERARHPHKVAQPASQRLRPFATA